MNLLKSTLLPLLLVLTVPHSFAQKEFRTMESTEQWILETLNKYSKKFIGKSNNYVHVMDSFQFRFADEQLFVSYIKVHTVLNSDSITQYNCQYKIPVKGVKGVIINNESSNHSYSIGIIVHGKNEIEYSNTSKERGEQKYTMKSAIIGFQPIDEEQRLKLYRAFRKLNEHYNIENRKK